MAREKLETIEGIELVDSKLVGQMGGRLRPSRMVLDVRGTGRTGYEIADALRRSYDVHLELPMQATVVFVIGLGESPATLRRLAGDVDEVVKRLSEPGATRALVPPAASLGFEVAVPPREAFLGEAELIAVDDAVGRILRVDRQLPARGPGAAAGRAHLGRHRRLPARAGGQRRAPARRQRPGVPDHQRASMIDPLKRWAQYGESPTSRGC